MIRQNTGPFPAALSINDGTNTQLLVENLLNLNRTFGSHAINATAGFTQERSEGDFLNASRATYSNEDIQVLNGGQEQIANSGTRVESRLNSYLGRASYTFRERYLLEANFRRDGSSRFGPANRWGNFYSGALGWIVSDESFFSSLPLIGGANYLKLRASYGTQGNQDFADYEWQATVVSRDATGESQRCCGYLFGTGQGTLTTGLAAVSLNNPALRWQDNKMTNVGFDLGLLNNRLSLSTEYYVSESDGVLARVPLIPSIGSRVSPYVNAASIRNSGIEVTLQHTMSRGDFELTSGLNLTTLKNEVLALGGLNEDIIVGASRSAIGTPLGSFWLMETCGVFDTQAEIDAHTSTLKDGSVVRSQPTARPGDLCFVDQPDPKIKSADGKKIFPDGQITQDGDKHNAGSPYPDFDTGLFLDGRYRALDFRIGVRGRFGSKVYNGLRPGLENTNGDSNAPTWLRPWKEAGDNSNAPKAYWGGPGANNARGPNDRFLEDNSYIRIQNLQLGYRLPANLLSSMGLQMDNARVYVTLQDIYTFTDYLGYDPEIRASSALQPGEDGGGAYPNPRTITIGFDLGF
jgi:TonB-linked SusC/RagA family outer membrane protein